MKREVVVDQRRVNAFYRTSLLVSIIVELSRCKKTRDEPAYSKKDAQGNRRVIHGVRASCIYFAMERFGVSQGKTKEILDAMVTKSRFLVRELAVNVNTSSEGKQSSFTGLEYVYDLADRDEVDEAVINALEIMPTVPYRMNEEESVTE